MSNVRMLKFELKLAKKERKERMTIVSQRGKGIVNLTS